MATGYRADYENLPSVDPVHNVVPGANRVVGFFTLDPLRPGDARLAISIGLLDAANP